MNSILWNNHASVDSEVHLYPDQDNQNVISVTFSDIKDGQKSFFSWSSDGIDFETIDKVLGEFYFRVFRYNDKFYSVAKNKNIDGIIYESDSWDGEFKPMFHFLRYSIVLWK